MAKKRGFTSDKQRRAVVALIKKRKKKRTKSAVYMTKEAAKKYG